MGELYLIFGLDATYSVKFNNDLFGSFPNESYTVVNGNIRLSTLNDHVSVNLFARNIFNSVYTTSSLFQDSIGELFFYAPPRRSEEHTSELQSLMRNSYAVFCLKKKNKEDKSSLHNLYNH